LSCNVTWIKDSLFFTATEDIYFSWCNFQCKFIEQCKIFFGTCGINFPLNSRLYDYRNYAIALKLNNFFAEDVFSFLRTWRWWNKSHYIYVSSFLNGFKTQLFKKEERKVFLHGVWTSCRSFWYSWTLHWVW